MKIFNDKKFDIIFIDGDHKEPQVSSDIDNCLKLISKNGVLCIDDVIKENNDKINKYYLHASDSSYKYLSKLSNENKISTFFFSKRINKKTYIIKNIFVFFGR